LERDYTSNLDMCKEGGVQASAMSRKLYTTVEVAKAAGLPRGTLQNWIKTGKVSAPPVRFLHNMAVRLWTAAQKKRIRRLSGFAKDRARANAFKKIGDLPR
jgi:hypothetical protein